MSQNKNTLLIVEDDQAIRDSLKDLFESEGYAVILAEQGMEAIEMLKIIPFPPALILLDLSMPVMDGHTFLKQLTVQFPQFSQLPVLIMTAAGSKDDPTNCDPNLIIRKPLDVDQLLDKVSSLIAMK